MLRLTHSSNMRDQLDIDLESSSTTPMSFAAEEQLTFSSTMVKSCMSGLGR